MDAELLNEVSARFQSFAAPYLLEQGDTFAYQLKVGHTDNVAGLAGRICKAENVPAEVALAARVAAWLHDVGRFPQYKEFRTFRDAESANHAALSVKHALRAGMLNGLPTEIKRLALGAVFLHNKRTLPAGLPPALDTAARIVRDSDKLDIFQVMITHFSQTEPLHPEVALHVKVHPTAYTPAILDDLRHRVTGDYNRIVYVNDFKLMVAGWLYDLNFKTSCALLEERRYLPTIFATLPDDAAIAPVREQVLADLAHRARGDYLP